MLDLRRVHGLINEEADRGRVDDLAWEGSFGEYLSLVLEIPRVARNARQRFHAMLVETSWGRDSVVAVSQPDVGVAELLGRVTAELSALARGQASSRCGGLVLLGEDSRRAEELFGLLRQRLALYSRTPDGAIFTFRWTLPPAGSTGEEPSEPHDCPVREEPLRLVPPESLRSLLAEINEGIEEGYPLEIEGAPCPFCRETRDALLKKYHGDWSRMVEHLRVYRLALSEGGGVATVEIGDGTARTGKEPEQEPEQEPVEEVESSAGTEAAESGTERLVGMEFANRGLVDLRPASAEVLPWVSRILNWKTQGDPPVPAFEGSVFDGVGLWAATQRDSLSPEELEALHRQAVVLGDS